MRDDSILSKYGMWAKEGGNVIRRPGPEAVAKPISGTGYPCKSGFWERDSAQKYNELL